MAEDPKATRNERAPSEASGPALGTVIADRYRLTARLGAGGMGTVYRAEHISLRMPVAVKFLHRFALTDPEIVARFEREAQAAAAIDHPHIAKAIDFGRLPDGLFYLVMEFVEGVTLAQVLRDTRRLPPRRAMKILGEIGAALTRAHALGIVHRDVKPDNVVLCTRQGDPDFVKVIDFGIARVPQAGAALTQLGVVFGTPGYLAPEQALGQRVDASADQYALGVVAFQLLTGRAPFVAEDALALLQQHMMAPIPRATDFAPDLPRALDGVLARMLAKYPAERFPSVDAAVAALRAVLDAAPSASPFAPSAPPAPPFGDAATMHGGAAATAPPPTASLASVPRPRSALPLALGALALLAVGGLIVAGVLHAFTSARTAAVGAHDAGADTAPAPLASAKPPPGAAPATADAEPADAAGPEPHRVSHHCRDGHCACRDALSCGYACTDEPCDAVCERMRTCRGECGDHCTQRCTAGQVCDLRCDGDCTTTCSDVHDCRVQCGENCRVDCSQMMDCAVRMRSGDVVCGARTGTCDVQCVLPDGRFERATRCARGRYHCPPGPC